MIPATRTMTGTQKCTSVAMAFKREFFMWFLCSGGNVSGNASAEGWNERVTGRQRAGGYRISSRRTGRRSSNDFRAAKPMTTGMRPSRPVTAVGLSSTTDWMNERISIEKLSV